MLRGVMRVLGGLLAVAIVAVSAIYVISSRIINTRHTFREHPVAVPSDSASIAQGERLTLMRCVGCHGDSLKGQIFFDEPNVARLVAPNVPAKLATLTDACAAACARTAPARS